MKKYAFTLAVIALFSAPVAAATVTTTFDDWVLNPVTIDDKEFTYIAGGGNFNNAALVFTTTVFPTQTVYDLNIQFAPGLTSTSIDLDYSIRVTDPSRHLAGMGLDTQIGSLSTNFNVTKTYYSSPGHVDQVAQLVSINGSNVSVLGNFGQLLYTHLTSTVPVGNEIDGLRDGYIQALNAVPEPGSLMLAGLGALGLMGLCWTRRRTA